MLELLETKKKAVNYYPFGKSFRSFTSSNGKHVYSYSGKEKDNYTDYSSYGFRYYNADLARWMNPDPAHQFNSPYVFNGNQPVLTIDKDGRFVWIVVAAVVGGTINLASNWDKVGSFTEGLSYFGVGAASGALATTGPVGWAAAGFINGAGNTAIAGGSFEQVVTSGGIGIISGLAGGYAGQWASSYLGNAVINNLGIKSPVVSGLVNGAIGGGVGGYAGGFVGGYVATGSFDEALNYGAKGFVNGLTIGGSIGAGFGYLSATQNNVDPWTGKQLPPKFEGNNSGESAGAASSNLKRTSQNDADTDFSLKLTKSRGKYIDENGRLIYPTKPRDGFAQDPIQMTLDKGMLIDRYGKASGRFVSPVGESWQSRSLPPGSAVKLPYNQYRVLKPITVDAGFAAPWFGQPGGAIQYKFNMSIESLIRNGYLKQVY